MNDIIIFWGAGKIGGDILKFWHLHGMNPDYFCDSNFDKNGQFYEGIEVIDTSRIEDFNSVIIFVTAYCFEEIYNQIKKKGYNNVRNIINASCYLSFEMLLYIYKMKNINIGMPIYEKRRLIMDFTYGTELGGVQTWCYQQEKILKQIGTECEFLMPDNRTSDCEKRECVYVSHNNELTKYDNYVDSFVKHILVSNAGVVVINFPREIMLASMIVKKLFKPDLKIIAVVHNDDDIYYEIYGKYREVINAWFVISDKINQKVQNLGINRSNIYKLKWKIYEIAEQNKYLDDYNNENMRIRIGYAGRIVKIQKRVDNIISLAVALNQRELNYEISIAGSGEDEEYLKKEIMNKGLDQRVKCLGMIEHSKIADFWKYQDIYLSCSDFEGHSISQCEAMAMGTVPVVTDTSGARDDIVDGVNGFILPIGDIECMADRIDFLAHNPGKLREMSEKCIEYIKHENNLVDEKKFWMNIWRIIA